VEQAFRVGASAGEPRRVLLSLRVGLRGRWSCCWSGGRGIVQVQLLGAPVPGSLPFSEGLAGVCSVEDCAPEEEGDFCSAGGFCARSAMPESKLNSKATTPNPNRVLFRLHVAELLLKKRSSPSFWIELRESDAGNPPEVGPKTRNRSGNSCLSLRTKLRQAQTTWNFCFLLY